MIGGASGEKTGPSHAIDLRKGSVFNLILDVDCTFAFGGAPPFGALGSFTLILKQTGGRAAHWPPSVSWEGGCEPALTAEAGHHDIFSFATLDGGKTWLGLVAGQRYA